MTSVATDHCRPQRPVEPAVCRVVAAGGRVWDVVLRILGSVPGGRRADGVRGLLGNVMIVRSMY